MAKIGTNLKACLLSISKGEVKLEEVDFIISNTQYSSRRAMIAELRKAFWLRDIEGHIQNATVLWSSGRIFQNHAVSLYKYRPTAIWIESPGILPLTL